MEEKYIRLIEDIANQYSIIILPVLSLSILAFFVSSSRGKTEISQSKIYNNLIFQFSITIIVVSGVFALLKTYLESKYQIYVTLSLNYLILIYILHRMFSKKSKNNFKIKAIQETYSKYVNQVDKSIFRKENQTKAKRFFVISHNLKKKIKKEHEFVNKFKNNINLLTKLEIKPEFLKKYDSIRDKTTKTKVNELNTLHKAIVESILYAYDVVENESKILRVEDKFNNIKFPISRLKLDYMIYKEYKNSIKTFISPMMNLMILAESQIDKDLIGALQNTAMTKLQSYGYNYYKIFIDLENESIERNNIKKITSLSSSKTINQISRFYELIEEEIQKFEEDFIIDRSMFPIKKIELDNYIFLSYKRISEITTNSLTEEQEGILEDIYEFYKDKTNLEMTELEDEIETLKQNGLNPSLVRDKEDELKDLKQFESERLKKLSSEEKTQEEIKRKEQERRNDIRRKLETKISSITFPISLIKLNNLIFKEYNKVSVLSQREDETEDKTPIPIFIDTLFKSSTNIVDRELIGSFENLFQENFQSIGYTYLQIFKTRGDNNE